MSLIGEHIPVSACVPGQEYMVDCEDGHSPYRMKLREIAAGTYKFVDSMGAKADLDVHGKVFLLPPAAAPAPPAAPPLPPQAKAPCGAPGCGVGCEPGYVYVEAAGATAPCPACNEAPFIRTTPTRAENGTSVVGAAALVGGEEVEVRGGNCTGSGRMVNFADQPSVVDGKVVCPVCSAERRIPKEIKKARPMPMGMPFPGHRMPKGEVVTPAAPAPPAPPTPLPFPDIHVAVSPEAVDEVLEHDHLVFPPVPAVLRAEREVLHVEQVLQVPHVPHAGPVLQEVQEAPVPPVPPVSRFDLAKAKVADAWKNEASLREDGSVILTHDEVLVLSAIFSDRAQAMKVALSDKTVELLKRLRLVG